jgi:hypothetical protein
VRFSLICATGKKIQTVFLALWHASVLNAKMLIDKWHGKKTLVFHVNASTQLMHITSVLREFTGRKRERRMAVYMLTSCSDVIAVRSKLNAIVPGMSVHPQYAVRFLLLCDFLLTVDQGMIFPFFGCKTRACCFHGQPSKGNSYKMYNYRQINGLFFYGPLMRDHYLHTKESHPQWPTIDFHEVGQPLSDHRLNHRQDKETARQQLGLDPSRFTVIYAPSFEYCSSLATHGTEIIEALIGAHINVIVKPHPAFYNLSHFGDKFNRDIPNAKKWNGRVRAYASSANCVFAEDDTLDSTLALSAADVMLTDFSGIAFDGFLFELGMIYWDCPLLYSEYLPRRYGVDGNTARDDLACNVGRDAGIVVQSTSGLIDAVDEYQADSSYKGSERNRIREQLLFNRGRATNAMANKIEEIIGAHAND